MDENREGVLRAYNHWAGKDLRDVVTEMPEPTYVPIDEMRDVQLMQILPDSADFDTTRTTALGLPFLNGLSPHQYIRAKTLQLILDPEVPLIVMPNNSSKNSAYTFTTEDRRRLAMGNIRPLGEIELLAFEELDKQRSLGALSITGYSQGALTALAMGAVGSSRLHVTNINADEAPSKFGRSVKRLAKDFQSGGLSQLFGAVKDADIDALSEAMRAPGLLLDIVRFGMQSLRADSKLIQRSMVGDVDGLVAGVDLQDVPVKLGFVEGSPMFSPSFESADLLSKHVTTIGYDGPGNRGHATGDNVILHALMAVDGLTRSI